MERTIPFGRISYSNKDRENLIDITLKLDYIKSSDYKEVPVFTAYIDIYGRNHTNIAHGALFDNIEAAGVENLKLGHVAEFRYIKELREKYSPINGHKPIPEEVIDDIQDIMINGMSALQRLVAEKKYNPYDLNTPLHLVEAGTPLARFLQRCHSAVNSFGIKTDILLAQMKEFFPEYFMVKDVVDYLERTAVGQRNQDMLLYVKNSFEERAKDFNDAERIRLCEELNAEFEAMDEEEIDYDYEY